MSRCDTALAVVEAARKLDRRSHSHKGLGHGQEGNMFYGWWEDCRFACPLCLALMVHDGLDIGWEFIHHLPHEVSDPSWWTLTWIQHVAPLVPDPEDKMHVRWELALRIRYGREERARFLARMREREATAR